MTTRWTRLAVLLTAGVLTAGLAACGGSADNGGSAGSSGDSSSSSSSMPSASAGAQGDAAAKTFGSGCSSVPKSGKGSFSGMAQDPVATAASNNPGLSTLVTAVKKAGLVNTLNNAKNITVFAPSNDAFAKIPKKDLNALLKNKKQLTKVLTYHVTKGRTAPGKLTAKPLTSLQGGKVKVAGKKPAFTVNGNSKVVCGNVQTSNATVYIVDTVLMPKK